MSREISGTESPGANGDRMAIAGLVCSLCVPLITALLIPVANMPSTSDTTGDLAVLLLMAGAVLWVAGLVLSILARSRALKYRGMATAGIVVSSVSPLLFVVVLIALFLQALDWFFNDFFTMGASNAHAPSIAALPR